MNLNSLLRIKWLSCEKGTIRFLIKRHGTDMDSFILLMFKRLEIWGLGWNSSDCAMAPFFGTSSGAVNICWIACCVKSDKRVEGIGTKVWHHHSFCVFLRAQRFIYAISWALICVHGEKLFALSVQEFVWHGSVINITFVVDSYFAVWKVCVTRVFLHIYTNVQKVHAETLLIVCTSSVDRVHTFSWVSADIVLQVVLTHNWGCAHGLGTMCRQTDEMYKYTIRLYKYAKLASRESHIWQRVFVWLILNEKYSGLTIVW